MENSNANKPNYNEEKEETMMNYLLMIVLIVSMVFVSGCIGDDNVTRMPLPLDTPTVITSHISVELLDGQIIASCLVPIDKLSDSYPSQLGNDFKYKGYEIKLNEYCENQLYEKYLDAEEGVPFVVINLASDIIDQNTHTNVFSHDLTKTRIGSGEWDIFSGASKGQFLSDLYLKLRYMEIKNIERYREEIK